MTVIHINILTFIDEKQFNTISFCLNLMNALPQETLFFLGIKTSSNSSYFDK